MDRRGGGSSSKWIWDGNELSNSSIIPKSTISLPQLGNDPVEPSNARLICVSIGDLRRIPVNDVSVSRESGSVVTCSGSGGACIGGACMAITGDISDAGETGSAKISCCWDVWVAGSHSNSVDGSLRLQWSDSNGVFASGLSSESVSDDTSSFETDS